MKPMKETRRMVKDMSFATGPEMDEHLWKAMAEQRHRPEDMTPRRAETRAWRILMKSKIAKLAVAAMVVVAALAVGVEQFTRAKQDKTHAFSAEIQANMALDLDPKGAIPLRQTRPGDFDVTWDGEDGGTLRIMPGSSLRLCTPSKHQPKADQALLWAYSILAEMPESTTTSVSARQSRFAAILTSDGNLAVVQIGDYDENKARLQWQVEDPTPPGYGPVQVVTLTCLDPEKPSTQPCAIDFDTGQTSVIPAQALSLPPEDLLDWLQQNGIDAIARVADNSGSLVGAGLVVQDLDPGYWVMARALNIRHSIAGIAYESRDPIPYREGQFQRVHPFKTREGGIGILQMRGMDCAERTLQFRYKMVQGDSAIALDGTGEKDAELTQIYASATWLADLGKYVLLYAGEHEDRLPQSLEELRDYAESDENHRWMVHDVEYLGAGLTCADPFSTVVAYDRTLLAAGKGTNVLFLDSRIEFVEAERLATLGLPAGNEK